jgi:acid phosphatase (class A)
LNACAAAPTAMMTPAAATGPHFVTLAAFDFTRLLPPPPAANSIFARAELDVVVQVQAARTPEQVAWAKVVDADTVFNFADTLGAWFQRGTLPATDAFFKDLGDDLRAMDRASKTPFQRPRPFAVDAAVQPCVRLPTSTSYPSGTALQEFAWAELLAEVFPDRRAALLARAERAAWGRVTGGVHFPSDLAAGRQLVPAFLAECRKSAVFRAGFERCRDELRAAVSSPESPAPSRP